MTREELFRYALDTWGAEPEYLWAELPGYAVLRHSPGGRWFALTAPMPRRSLGLPGEGLVDVVDLKLDPALVYILREQPGYRPAYHMNKTHWLTVLLDGSVPPERVRDLLTQSFELTKKTMKKRSARTAEESAGGPK